MNTVEAFYEKALVDEKLQKEVLEVLAQETPIEEAVEKLAAIGMDNGFEFTPQEARRFLEGRRTEELSDDELDSVSGGGPILEEIREWLSGVADKVGQALAEGGHGSDHKS